MGNKNTFENYNLDATKNMFKPGNPNINEPEVIEMVKICKGFMKNCESNNCVICVVPLYEMPFMLAKAPSDDENGEVKLSVLESADASSAPLMFQPVVAASGFEEIGLIIQQKDHTWKIIA